MHENNSQRWADGRSWLGKSALICGKKLKLPNICIPEPLDGNEANGRY